VLWFTYRRDFPQMTPYDFTSDAGWGCMLRSAQMLLGQALQRRLLGRNWRLPALFEAEVDARLPEPYVKLLRWFADSPDLQCRYSIHHMVKLGMQYDKLPGEWYGPTTAAQVLRDLVNLHRREFGGELAMYVPQEGVVYTDDVTRLCVSHLEDEQEKKEVLQDDGEKPAFYDPLLHPPTTEDSSDWSTALLILIPLRLGLDQLNERYVPAIEKTFTFPQSVGIIGGKKGHSVYFVGTQQDQLHLLDPHDVHPAPELNAAFPTAVRTLCLGVYLAMLANLFLCVCCYGISADTSAHSPLVSPAGNERERHRSVAGAGLSVRESRGLRRLRAARPPSSRWGPGRRRHVPVFGGVAPPRLRREWRGFTHGGVPVGRRYERGGHRQCVGGGVCCWGGRRG
jgi:hypothetical protein